MTGDFFGVMPMLDGTATEGAFVTASRCRLLKLFREDFHPSGNHPFGDRRAYPCHRCAPPCLAYLRRRAD
jgi:hypothetical protein